MLRRAFSLLAVFWTAFAFSSAHYSIEIQEQPETPTACLHNTSTNMVASDRALRRILKTVAAYLKSEGLAPTGAAYVRYLTYRPGQVIVIEAGFPVDRPIVEKGGIQRGTIPGGTVARTLHVGSYEGIDDAYVALDEWVRANKRIKRGGPWNRYLDLDPAQVAPDRLRTEVDFPLQ